MTKKRSKTVEELRAEAAAVNVQIGALRLRIRDGVISGTDTGPLRTDLAGHVARIAEINLAILAETERREKGDLLAIDAVAQRMTAEVQAGIAAMIEALQPPEKPVQA
jgi:hypothetical protein